MAIRFLDEEEDQLTTPSVSARAGLRFLDEPDPVEVVQPSVPTPAIGAGRLLRQTQPDLTEQQLDIQEEAIRPTAGQFAGGLFSSALQEVKGALRTGAEVGQAVATDLLTIQAGSPEEVKKLGKKRLGQAVDIAKQSPQIAKTVIKDLGRTFGVDFSRPGSPVDLDVAIQKWREAPVESALDATMVGGALKAVGKGAFKSASRAISKSKKSDVQKIIGKGDVETQKLLQNVSNRDVSTTLDDLYTESPIIKKLNLSDQLDNPNFAEEIGKSSVDNINRLKKREQIKLNSAINKIKDQPVNVTDLSNDVAEGLKRKGFLKEGTNVLDIENIEPGLSKSALTTEIKKLNQPGELNAGQLRLRMQNLDNKINWKNPKVADEGLIEVRKAYRNQLRLMSPEFNEQALRVAEKLDKFEPKLRRLEKVGAGERFGKSMFQTKEELNEFIRLMEKSPDKLAGAVNADLKTLKAWHAWNKYFKQNPDFILGEIPGVSRTIVPAVKKRLIKTDISLGRARGRSLGRIAKEGQVPLRVGLEVNQEEQ